MTDPLTRCDLAILGEALVYPGHPAMTAYLILRLYEGRLSDAFGRGEQFATVEEDGRIPGAGGHASAGLEMIERVLRGMSPDESMRFAENVWDHCDDQSTGGYPLGDEATRESLRARWRDGQEQADRFKARLVAELTKIAAPNPPAT